jgi:4-amino-4-deoxy-L-arabinose transferase-like glycosyltransferase
MTQNLHAFLFNSLDSVGFVTIDKPPVGFWIQTISAKLLGFSGFSILLPEALATIGSVALLYHLVKRAFGGVAGLLAALALALVPISIAVGRNSTIDSLLVFTLLGTVWTGLKATERGSLTWLLATGAIIGLGFEIKMMEAYLVLPALGLVYLLAAPISRRLRLLHLGLATGVMLGVSLAWPIAVDLTPANLRPWIDSTQDNSAISLALGYNGIQRLLGQNQSITQFLSGLGIKFASSTATTTTTTGMGGGMFNNGNAGILRLFDEQLAGQASWLLPLSLMGIGLGAWRALKDHVGFVHSHQGQATIVFGTWLLAAAAFFSVANFFHSYYLVTLGPPIAALAAISVTTAWQSTRKWLLLPTVLVSTALVQAHILSYYPTWSTWLDPVVLGGAAIGSALVVVSRFRTSRMMARVGTGVAITALLVAPLVWSGYTTLYASSGLLPSAGPQVANTNGAGFGRPGGAAPAPDSQSTGTDGAPQGGAPQDGAPEPDGVNQAGMPQDGGPGGGMGGQVSSELISYLEANQGSATYLAATTNSQAAASIILASDQPVMSLGGFTGSDPILTVDQFANLVESGEVRYVLASGGFGGGPGGQSGTSSIMSWVQANGTLVTITSSDGSQTQVYDLSSLQGAAA